LTVKLDDLIKCTAQIIFVKQLVLLSSLYKIAFYPSGLFLPSRFHIAFGVVGYAASSLDKETAAALS
jgi:hypothetical protein